MTFNTSKFNTLNAKTQWPFKNADFIDNNEKYVNQK